MTEAFQKWRAYLKENEGSFVHQEDKGSNGGMVEHTFSAPSYSAGIWFQSEEGEILTYNHCDGDTRVGRWSFQGENVPGPEHRHDFIEIGIVVEGVAKQQFFGEMHEFRTGDFWIVDRKCYHNDLYNPEKLTTVYLGIPTEIFDAAFIRQIGQTEMQTFLSLAILNKTRTRQFLHLTPKGDTTKTVELMEGLYREIMNEEFGFQDVVKGYLSRLIRTLALDYDFILTSQEKQQMSELLFLEIKQYIYENYKTVTIQDLIDRFHYSINYYNRLIKKYSGLTFMETVQAAKLEDAKRLLETTDYTIEEIMEQVDYQSRAGFYKAFVNKYGMTPAKYKRSCLEETNKK